MPTFQRNKVLFYLIQSADWIFIVLLFVSIKLFNKFVPPFQRRFSLKDTSIAYPHKDAETIDKLKLWLLSLILPVVVICIIWIRKRNIRETYFALLGLFLSSMLAYFICHFIKNLVGRLRPDFLDRCHPDLAKAPSNNATVAILSEISICNVTTAKEKFDLRGGSQSFFSGHTSTAFSGLGFLSIYLAYALCLWHRPGRVYKVIIVLIPLLIALFIGLSRVSDYRHHWEDVLVGMLVGLLCALFSFRYYFPINKVNEPAAEEYALQRDDASGEESVLV